ncbi:MAG TPA: hypothetical protein VHB69_00285 [Mycobacteriales bacterium]|nr:hypothetical protein [Mycobacteriales bacterium]
MAQALGVRLMCAAQAAAEALFLHEETDDGPVPVPVELHDIEIVELAPHELADYISLAVSLDDGEAATLALARSRGWPVVTDDRKAIRIAGSLRPAVRILDTPALLKLLARALRLDDAAIANTLRMVEERASFVPSRSSPDAEWWSQHREPR